MKILHIATSLLLVIINQSLVNGLNCYQCNSANNSACTILEDKIIIPTQCQEIYHGTDPFCRKTVIAVRDLGGGLVSRVIRSCGFTPNKTPCYKNNNGGHEEIVCQCFEDGCNSSSMKLPSIIVLLIPFITFVFMKHAV